MRIAKAMASQADASGFPMWQTLAKLMLAATSCQLSPCDSAVQDIRAAVADLEQQHTARFVPFAHGLLADGYHRLGRLQDAEASLETAFQAIDAMGERWFTSELWRLKAVLAAEQQSPEQAADVFEHALAAARSHKHRLAELNIVLDYFRHCQSHDLGTERVTDAVNSLRDWFTGQGDDWLLERITTGIKMSGTPDKGRGTHVNQT